MMLLVCTDKGLIVYRYENNSWRMADSYFIGMPVSKVMADERSGRWWAALNHKHWGPKLHYSDNMGREWFEACTPKFDTALNSTVKSIWTLSYGRGDDPGRFYVGVEPAALFVTEDNGDSFRLLSGLSNHASRSTWVGGGKGSKDPFLHTLLVDPDDVRHLYAAISCAGIFQSWDQGESWKPTNEGMEAMFLPEPNVMVGHDPHDLRIAPSNTKIIWQQNHCGIYLSEDKGISWTNVSATSEDPAYGFCLAVDEKDENRAWVVPAQSDDQRFPRNHKLMVYQTRDKGRSWESCDRGLPGNAFDLILRHAIDLKGEHIVFGSNNGNLYHTSDLGENWSTITQNLSTVRDALLISG